jgi:hypothetical protein
MKPWLNKKSDIMCSRVHPSHFTKVHFILTLFKKEMEHISQVSIKEYKQMTCQYSTELIVLGQQLCQVIKERQRFQDKVVSEMLMFLNYLLAQEDFTEECHHENLTTCQYI